MCGRYTLRRDGASIRRELRAEAGAEVESWAARYNIAPTDKVPILLRKESGARHIELMSWGIVRERTGRAARQINGRSESVNSRSPRCAVISDGFYEWGGAKGPNRQPYFFHRPDDGLILMAGIWQVSRIGGARQSTFVILTTAANGQIAPIHDRMPALLDGDTLALWLNPKTTERDLRGLLGPAPVDALEMRPASTLVNSVKNEGPELLAGLLI